MNRNGSQPLKYLVHNVPDSDWNITGNKYVLIITDTAKTELMKCKERPVRNSDDDPMPFDFVDKKTFVRNQLETHVETLARIFAYIASDVFQRTNKFDFIIESHIDDLIHD